jgi:hypothetical protein
MSPVSFGRSSFVLRILISVTVLMLVCGITGKVGINLSPSLATTSLQASTVAPSGLVPASGGLLVQNRSPHPVRVVLLSRSVKKALDTQPKDAVPAHWDFVPWEGRLKGVLVVLAERTVRLKPGDVVVAFAQDGSQRYWGPFVVGETAQPIWDQEQESWRMVLGE